MKQSQYEAIARLICRKSGATPLELLKATNSTSVHKRMSEMKKRGWRITREPIPGKSYGRYRGVQPT